MNCEGLDSSSRKDGEGQYALTALKWVDFISGPSQLCTLVIEKLS
jgi:hypothetical protein